MKHHYLAFIDFASIISNNGQIFKMIQDVSVVHSDAKCMAWVKKCHHVGLDKNFDPSLLTNKRWHVFMWKKQKKILENKTIQNGRLKKKPFFKIANPLYFLWKFHGLVLGLIELIDGKGIYVVYLIVASTNTCYYSENQIFCFYKVSNANVPIFFRKKTFCLSLEIGQLIFFDAPCY